MDDLETIENEIVSELEEFHGIGITEHGMKRIRQRLGLPKSAAIREVERAQNHGVPREELSGRIRSLMDNLFYRYGNCGDYRVYRNFIFVFKSDLLVTVFEVPKRFQGLKIKKKG